MSNQADSASLLKTYCISTWMSQKNHSPTVNLLTKPSSPISRVWTMLKKVNLGYLAWPFPSLCSRVRESELGHQLTVFNLKQEIGWKKRSLSNDAVPHNEQVYQTGCAVLPSRQADGGRTTAIPRSLILGCSLLFQHMHGCTTNTQRRYTPGTSWPTPWLTWDHRYI